MALFICFPLHLKYIFAIFVLHICSTLRGNNWNSKCLASSCTLFGFSLPLWTNLDRNQCKFEWHSCGLELAGILWASRSHYRKSVGRKITLGVYLVEIINEFVAALRSSLFGGRIHLICATCRKLLCRRLGFAFGALTSASAPVIIISLSFSGDQRALTRVSRPENLFATSALMSHKNVA